MHSNWTWFYDMADEVVQHVMDAGIDYYHTSSGHRRTCRGQHYTLLLLDLGVLEEGRQATIFCLEDTLVCYFGYEPSLAVCPSQPENLLEHLGSWVGQLIFDATEDKEQDRQWYVSALDNGSVICIITRSYDRKPVPDISGACIHLYCTKSQRILLANIYKQPKTTSSYSGDFLGLITIHITLLFLCCFYIQYHFHITQHLL